ncbi:hypothetical protein NHQ30_005938 [Ciborinia camelliae]|nr:hypothetical protein NHQ30_005938 [Ciborinia camelliae]
MKIMVAGSIDWSDGDGAGGWFRIWWSCTWRLGVGDLIGRPNRLFEGTGLGSSNSHYGVAGVSRDNVATGSTVDLEVEPEVKKDIVAYTVVDMAINLSRVPELKAGQNL